MPDCLFSAGKSCQSLVEEFGRVHDKLSSDRSAFFIDSTLVTRNADSATSIGDLRSGSGQQRGQNEVSSLFLLWCCKLTLHTTLGALCAALPGSFQEMEFMGYITDIIQSMHKR